MIIISVLYGHKLMILHTNMKMLVPFYCFCVKIPLYNYFWRKQDGKK